MAQRKRKANKSGLEALSGIIQQRLRALKLYVEYGDYSIVAAKMDTTPEQVENMILKLKDDDWNNVVDAAMIMTTKKSIEILIAVLNAMNDPEKIKSASLSQLATVAGILTDKVNIMSGRPTSVSKKISSIDVKAFEKVKKGFGEGS